MMRPAPGNASINKYRFAGELGRGGLGVVRLAEDTQLRREVAVKLILDVGDPDAATAMIDEAQITGQLEHPNIVPVHELGTDGSGRPYMAMKRIQGRTLQEVIDETDRTVRMAAARPTPDHVADAQRAERQQLDAFIKVCDAMAYAHSRRVIHRDLKPANIMVGDFGEVLVVDWGLARPIGSNKANYTVRTDRRQEGANLTVQGEVFGTPAYMPPEQAQGRASELDERSDIYSLGAILYTALTGSAPFTGSIDQILDRVSRGQVPLPSKRSRNRDVPRELEAVVMQAMAFEPDDRYQTVAELKEDVEAYLDGRRLAAAEYSPWQLLGKWMKRHKAIVLTVGASAAALIVVVVLFIMGLQAERDRADSEAVIARAAEKDAAAERDKAREAETAAAAERDNARAAEHQAAEQRDNAVTAEAEAQRQTESAVLARDAARKAEVAARRQLAGARIAQGDALLLTDRVNDADALYREAREILTSIDAPTFSADLAIGNRYTTAPPPLWTLPIGVQVRGVGFTGDGRTIWCAAVDGYVRLFDAATGMESRRIPAHNGGVVSAAAFADGRRLATGGMDRLVKVWDLETGRELQRFGPVHSTYVVALAVSTDGKQIASGGAEQDKNIYLYNTDSPADEPRLLVLGRGHAVTTSHARGVNALAFSPDGTRLISGSVDTSAHVWDLATGKSIISLRPTGQSHVNTVGWSPDGKTVITGGIDRIIHVWRGDNHESIRDLAVHRGWVMASAISHDSRYILSGSRDHTLRLTELETGEVAQQFVGHTDSVTAVGFSPDSRLAVSGSLDGTLRLWRTPVGVSRYLWNRGDDVTNMRLSRDGRVCITSGASGVADVRDVATGVILLHEKTHRMQNCGVAISPDDRYAAVGGQADDKALRIYDLATGQIAHELDQGPGVMDGYSMLRFSQDGRMLASGSLNGPIYAWDTATWQMLAPFRAHKREVDEIVFSADGSRMFSVAHDAQLVEWDVASRRIVRYIAAHQSLIYALDMSPDGKLLATGSHDETGNVFDITGSDIALVHSIKDTHRGNVRAVAFSPDGRYLFTASADATLRMHDMTDWTEVRAWEPHGTEIASVAVSPDGSFVLTGGADDRVRRLDLDYAREYERRDAEAQQLRSRLAGGATDSGSLLALASWYAWREAPALALHLYERARSAGARVSSLAMAQALMQLDRRSDAVSWLQRARSEGEIPPGYADAVIGAMSR